MKMWDRSIKLPLSCEETRDADGFPTKKYTFASGIAANYRDVTRTDEILADQKGFRADAVFEILACNYSGQNWLVDESTDLEYDIKRSYRKDKANIVYLTCERRERGG